AAVKAGLADGTIDAIATDHAPHTPDSKELPFDQAPPGMLGLEYALALGLTELDLPLHRLIELMSVRPAQIARMPEQGRPVAVGEHANLCVIDTAAAWTIDDSGGASRSRNVPYVGRRVSGRVRHTVCGGEPVVIAGVAQR
ncbi:MAG TPA: dihydroorotase, partial [Candidatus Microthrix parvicella]|nr:dihydroorotase [Candidatus Microthrix parvicella]